MTRIQCFKVASLTSRLVTIRTKCVGDLPRHRCTVPPFLSAAKAHFPTSPTKLPNAAKMARRLTFRTFVSSTQVIFPAPRRPPDVGGFHRRHATAFDHWMRRNAWVSPLSNFELRNYPGSSLCFFAILRRMLMDIGFGKPSRATLFAVMKIFLSSWDSFS